MAFDAKAATPDTSFGSGAFLMGADSQSAADPSIYAQSTVWDYWKTLANTWTANSAVSAPASAYTGTWFTGGTATTNKPHFLIEPTGTTSTGWSTAGTGLGINAASGFTGSILDVQLNGSGRFAVRNTATYINAGNPGGGYTVVFGDSSSYPTVGTTGSSVVYLGSGNGGYCTVNTQSGTVTSNGGFQLNATAFPSTTGDVILARDAANTLALRNGANAQTQRWYNTYTDSSNGEWFSAAWATNVLQLTTRANGTGAARALSLGVGATGQWQINTSGHFLATTDNTYDIGASGATRPRNAYIGNAVITSIIRCSNFNTESNTHTVLSMTNGSDNLLFATGGTSPRINFCGTTSSFPALKRSSTVLQARLADDSDFAPLQGKLRTEANAVAETPTATHTMIITDAGGTAYRVLCCV